MLTRANQLVPAVCQHDFQDIIIFVDKTPPTPAVQRKSFAIITLEFALRIRLGGSQVTHHMGGQEKMFLLFVAVLCAATITSVATGMDCIVQ